MQNTTNINSSQQSEPESILFYGEFASISSDTQMKGGAINSSLLLDAVKEHQNDTYLTVMDTNYISLSTELKKEVLEINPNTQFIQVKNLEEFTNYYDRGMDREVHPVESVTTIDSVMFYDTIEKEQPEVKTEATKPKEYVKLSEVGYLGVTNELSRLDKEIRGWSNEEFI